MIRPNFIKRLTAGTLALAVSAASIPILTDNAHGADCPAVRIIFARGSGEDLGGSNYREFKSALEPYLESLTYEFYELGSQTYNGHRYNAVDIGTDSLGGIINLATAKLSGGEGYEFGASVARGVGELKAYIASALSSCPNTQFVLGGYSQGAMVMSKAIREINSKNIAYVATFGDPKLYLPEGAGKIPAACTNPDSLSPYRAYVPDCTAYEGILGGYRPYQPTTFDYSGKLGTWCNFHDLMCSNKVEWDNLLGAHTSYVSDHRYSDAAPLIASKIYAALGSSHTITAPTSTHDLAILIDSTGSMTSLIRRYKDEALRLATNIITGGGRVALYEYRDLRDPFQPILHCDFDTCTLETFAAELDKIHTSGGGDANESLLSASLTAMNTLRWRVGATKTILALTDAGLVLPDRDGTTLSQVISRSLEIDPVHIYVLTPSADENVRTLVEQTGGKIFNTTVEDFTASTDHLTNLEPEGTIYFDGQPVETTSISNLTYEITGDTLHLDFTTDAARVLLVINDTIFGFTDQTSLEITDLNLTTENTISLVPFSENGDRSPATSLIIPAQEVPVIGVPATGFLSENAKNSV